MPLNLYFLEMELTNERIISFSTRQGHNYSIFVIPVIVARVKIRFYPN